MTLARLVGVLVGLGCVPAVVTFGCSGDSASAVPGAQADAGPDATQTDAASDATGEDAAPDAPAPVCAAGAAVGADGACHPFGIQGCASMFLGADNLCHPTLAKCPAGTIPQFATGCVPVGIPGCAAVFLEADGLCHPSAKKCPAATIPVPTEGCVSVDPPAGCGAAPFGDVPDAPGSIYVDASASAGGDGSKAKPFTTIAAAVAKVASGGRVVLAAGTYAEPIIYEKGYELVGRCASMVRVTGKKVLSNGSATVILAAGTAAMRNVTIASNVVGLLGVAGSMAFDHVHFEKTVGMGIYLAGASATGSYVLVDDTVQTSATEFYGGGLKVLKSNATFSKSAFVRNAGSSVAVAPASTLKLDDVLIEGTVPWTDGLGMGLEVDSNAKATVSASALVGQTTRGAHADGAGSKLDISTSIIEGTQLGASGQAHSLLALKGGATSLTDSVMVANAWVGVLASGATSTAAVTRSLIAGMTALPGSDAYAADAELSAAVTLVDSTISGTPGYGVVASAMGTASMDGVLVEKTVGTEHSTVAGLLAIDSATATAQRSAFVGNAFAGLLADLTSTVQLADSLVEGSTPTADGYFGVGIYVEESSTLGLSRCLVVDNVVTGVLGTSKSTLTIEATRVATTKLGAVLFDDDPGPLAGLGDGLVVLGGASATVTSTLVSGCARAGIVFDTSAGSIAASAAHGNSLGIVLQHDPKPTVGTDNDFSSNTKANVTSDGSLPVPNGNVPVPKM